VGSRLLREQAPVLHVIAERVGTPVYVYDAELIRGQYHALGAALEAVPHRLFYSVKANSNRAVLGLLRSLGAGVDVVSVGEIERALRAGFAPSEIVFSGVGKGEGELRRAVESRWGERLAVAGVGVGLLAAGLLSSVMASILFGVSALDPLTYGAVSVALLAVAVTASWIPARRAASVDPSHALRDE